MKKYFFLIGFVLLFSSSFAQTNTSSGFQLTFNASGGFTSINQSIYDVALNSDLPFPISSNPITNQVTYQTNAQFNGNSVYLKLINSLDLSEIFCFGVSCLFTYNDTWLSNSNVLLYQLCNSEGGCSISYVMPFILKDGGEGIDAGIHLTLAKNISSTTSPSLYDLILSYSYPYVSSSNYTTKSIVYTEEINKQNYPLQTSLKLYESYNVLNEYCSSTLGSSDCSFTYDTSFLSSQPRISWFLCNSAGGCLSNQQSFPFTLNSGGEGINAGIYFLGEVDFNGTIISSGNNNSIQSKNSKIGFPQSSFFSSLFTLVLIMMYFLV
jgi:hypothetical protein